MDGESLFSDLASPSRPHINQVWRWLLPIALSFPSQISASLSFLSLCGGTWWARQRWLPGAMASDPDPPGLRSLPAPVVTPCPWVSGRPGGGGVRGGGSGRSHRCLSAHALPFTPGAAHFLPSAGQLIFQWQEPLSPCVGWGLTNTVLP